MQTLRLPRAVYVLGACILGLAHPAEAQTIDVGTPEALAAAVAQIEPGSVIRLAPGNYGAISLRGLQGDPDRPITIASADPTRQAVLSRLNLRDLAHVDLRDLTVDYVVQPGDTHNTKVIEITGSQDVTLERMTVDGDVAQDGEATDRGFPTAYGLTVRNVDGFTIRDSEIRTFYRGLIISESSDVSILANNLHDLRMDGMNLAQVTRVLIERNWLHDFQRSTESADHPDMIQFWTASTQDRSSNIVIRQNILNSGQGAWTQSIFMRNEEVDRGRRSFGDMAYRNVLIEGNLIVNAHAHGITVGESEGLVVRNNTLVFNPTSAPEDNGKPLWVPGIRISESSRDVTIEDNVTGGLTGYSSQPDWAVGSNLLVQDRTRAEANFYGAVFVGGDRRDAQSYRLNESSGLNGTTIGAPVDQIVADLARYN